MRKTIGNQLVPHFTAGDAWHMARNVVRPPTDTLDFAPWFGAHYRLYTHARVALLEMLQSLPPEHTQRGKVIGIPAYTCAVVALPFLAAGWEIVWLDTDEWGLLDTEKATPHLEALDAILVIHTFGQRVDLRALTKACRAAKTLFIVDGAHTLQALEDEADVTLLSFGREKAVSTVSGGALVWTEKSRLHSVLSSLPELQEASKKWQLQHALQPWVGLATVNLGVCGKAFGALCAKLGLLPKAVTKQEKAGQWSAERATLPRAFQAHLARQLTQHPSRQALALARTERMRHALETTFGAENIRVAENGARLIIKTENVANIRAKAKTQSLWLREWDGCPLSPAGTDLSAFGYTPGQCPVAEKAAQTILTLPTHIHVDEEAEKRIIETLCESTP